MKLKERKINKEMIDFLREIKDPLKMLVGLTATLAVALTIGYYTTRNIENLPKVASYSLATGAIICFLAFLLANYFFYKVHKEIIKNILPFSKGEKNHAKKNKGYIRLLKDLEKEWPTEWRQDKIWNKYQCYSTDLKSMVKNGLLFETKTDKGSYYKLGIAGFQYLYIRKINYWVISGVIIASLSFLVSIILSI